MPRAHENISISFKNQKGKNMNFYLEGTFDAFSWRKWSLEAKCPESETPAPGKGGEVREGKGGAEGRPHQTPRAHTAVLASSGGALHGEGGRGDSPGSCSQGGQDLTA